MNPFIYIWNAAIFNRFSCGNGCIVVIVGLVSMIFGARTATNMTLCSRNESMPCVLKYGETKNACAGGNAYTNMTLRLDANTIPQNVSISVQGNQFSKGPVVSGQFHQGDKAINRWTNKISFQGNTMTYELLNSEIEFRDEFECHMEIDIEGEKFISKHFKWFDVNSHNCITKPPSIKDTTEQYLANITEQLDHLRVSMNYLASDVAELRKTNTHLQSGLKDVADNMKAINKFTVSMNSLASDMADVAETTKEVKNLTVSTHNAMKKLLDHLKDIEIGDIILSGLQVLLTIPTMVLVCCVLACNRDQPGPPSNNPNTDDERRTTSNLIELNTTVRSQSMPSPEDEVH